MKVSTLMRDIVDEAESYFGVSDHTNDCISVGIYLVPDDTWQAWLERPTQNQLDCGEVDRFETVKTFENSITCYVEDQPTLVDALLALQSKLRSSLDWGVYLEPEIGEPKVDNEDEEEASS